MTSTPRRAILTLEHTSAEGTLCEGTTKDDGSAAILKAHGWRWGRSIGAWFLPRSRDTAPKRAIIEETARALREAGWQVEVRVDAHLDAPAAVEQRRAARAIERAERHEARAQSQQTKADGRERGYRAISDHIPLGQPILLGHHSQAKAERDHERMRAHLEASVEHERRAGHHREAAERARMERQHANSPLAVARRIDRLAVEVRRLERQCATLAPGGAAWVQLTETLAEQRAKLEHWQGVRAEQIARGEVREFGPHNVKAGDQVKVRGQWCVVARCNRQTVAVQTAYSWTDKTPWREVVDHRPG